MSTSVSSSSAGDRIRADLLPGERMLWEGRPNPRVHFTAADAFILPFSIVWCGFAISWVVAVAGSARPAFAAFGLPFVAIGLYLVVGRFVYKAHRKRLTVYAVTDRRIVVATGADSISHSPVRDRPTTVRRRRGHVSIVIGGAPGFQRAAYANTGLDFWARGAGDLALWDVADAEPLLAALRRAQGG